MRKLLSIAAASLAATLALTACGSTADQTGSGTQKVVVGANPVPHAKILEYVATELAPKAGIELEIKQFDDYVLPNKALSDGELDANYFQHLPYLTAEVAEKGYDFEHGKGVHIEPLRLFSSKVKSANDVPDGAKVAISNDVSNQARGLLLLQQAGLLNDITLETSVLNITPQQNPKGLTFEETQPEVIVQLVDDPNVDLALVNANFVLAAGLDPEKSIASESVADSPYSNLLVWRKDNKNEAVAKLEELLHSTQVQDFIKSNWPAGDVIPG